MPLYRISIIVAKLTHVNKTIVSFRSGYFYLDRIQIYLLGDYIKYRLVNRVYKKEVSKG